MRPSRNPSAFLGGIVFAFSDRSPRERAFWQSLATTFGRSIVSQLLQLLTQLRGAGNSQGTHASFIPVATPAAGYATGGPAVGVGSLQWSCACSDWIDRPPVRPRLVDSSAAARRPAGSSASSPACSPEVRIEPRVVDRQPLLSRDRADDQRNLVVLDLCPRRAGGLRSPRLTCCNWQCWRLRAHGCCRRASPPAGIRPAWTDDAHSPPPSACHRP